MSDQNNTGVNDQNDKNIVMHTPTPIVSSHHAHVGPILGVLVIMLVLILAGLYLWGGELREGALTPIETPIVNNEPETMRADADIQMLETVSPSDDLSAIEADVSSTNFDSIDTDLTAIESEFNTSANLQ